VDKLVLVRDGKETELENRNNEDVYRLYEGTYLIPQRPLKLLKEETRRLKIGGTEYLCSVQTSGTKVLNKRARLTVVESGEFPWTHAGAEYREEKGGLIYGMEVLEQGKTRSGNFK